MKKLLFFQDSIQILKKTQTIKVDLIINITFIQKKSGTQHSEMLYTVDGPFQLIHADVANLKFSSKSVVAPKY